MTFHNLPQGRVVFGLVLALGAAAASAQDTLAAPEPAAAAAQPLDKRSAQRPLWELGLGVGGLTLPDYRGSAERSNYLLPLPYVVYRGTWLKADREGARAVLFDARRVEVDISVNGSPPTRGESRGARAGMDDLPGTVEVGPNVNVTLWRSGSKGARLDLRLPVRTAITLERSPRTIGSVFTPNLNLDIAGVAGGWNVGLQGGPMFATRRYHQHFYGVEAADATATRPAYRASGGHGGWQTLAAVSRRFERTWVGAFVRYDHLRGAVFEDSPLVERRHHLSAGIGVSWVLATSEQMVQVDD
ncbi:MipA/OmpV family protein [Aquabacterium sp. A7-Y]|uniref:MipA/OmpV family protein n=1 Tax=Aquabacterium sp. A7-Y TaxID=1349605 RepID=UPI00223DF544|nr:MipA/OmpV family protein [Aquabacterium sp. A7-Y]MCW7536435.1 MipA/OmpV family protein [Aquabacterium sp. A7-Y]